MTTILLNGIPNTKKSNLMELTKYMMREHYDQTVDIISVPDLVSQASQEFLPASDLQFMDTWLQKPYRREAIRRAGSLLENSEADHQIVEMPLSMYYREGKVYNAIFEQFNVQQLHHSRKFDYVITLIDDPQAVAEEYADSPFPTEISTILDWMSIEVNNAKIAMPYSVDHQNGFVRTDYPRRLVIPRPFSDESLVKLMADENPVIIYLAGPITSLLEIASDSPEEAKEKLEAIQRKADFRDQLQQFAIIIAPLELADLITEPKAVEYTIYRDIDWFITLNADITVAHYPGNFPSSGTVEEENHTNRIGKPLIRIHPKETTQVFSSRPTNSFPNESDFLKYLRENIEPSSPAYFKRMMTSDLSAPRFAHLYKDT